MRKYKYYVGARLTDEDLKHWENILRRFSKTSSRNRSEQFRSVLRALDFPYETEWDNEDVDESGDRIEPEALELERSVNDEES